MNIKTLSTWLLSMAVAVLLAACDDLLPKQVSLQGKTMGTTYHITYIDNGKAKNLPKQEVVQQQIDALLKEVNNQMSTYQKDSQISKFNQFREVNTPFPVAEDFALVVKEAIRLNKMTDGALDITIGPLVNLWGFGPDKRLNREPTAEQIEERSKSVGIEKIEVKQNGTEFSLIKHEPNLYIDLSSIAKGFGVDKVAMHLESLGVRDYLVEIGGELRSSGYNFVGKPWTIGIEQPTFAQEHKSAGLIFLSNNAVATSGNYRNYFEDEQGNRLSHIIDPKLHKPIQHNLASITVIADSSMTSDGLSTGLFVLGPEKALEVAEREKLAIFMIIKNGSEYQTKASSEFEKRYKLGQ